MSIRINSNRIRGFKFMGLLTLLAVTVGCGDKNSGKQQGVEAPTNAQQKPAAEHEEAAPTIATLNEEQIKTIGIQYG